MENLHELDHKIKFLNLQDFNDCRAVYDVHDVVDKLKLRAVAKTREYLLQKVYQFRKPMANYQMLQNQLLNYRLPPSPPPTSHLLPPLTSSHPSPPPTPHLPSLTFCPSPLLPLSS